VRASRLGEWQAFRDDGVDLLGSEELEKRSEVFSVPVGIAGTATDG
jgi:hypothetical protein